MWTLLIWVYYSGNAITTIPNFNSQQTCEAAARKIERNPGFKNRITWECVSK